MTFPAELKYTKDHEWLKMLDDTTALVGITDFAQSELGDLVFINLPQEGDEVSPVDGVIAEVNTELEDEPQKLNEDPYGAWIAKVEKISGYAELMDAAAYEAFVQK